MSEPEPARAFSARFPGAIIRPYRGVWPTIDDSAFVAPGAVVIGDVVIGAEASVWYGCVLRGDDEAIRVGARSNIQDGSIVHVFDDERARHPTEIGAGVTVGHAAKLHGCRLEPGCLVGIGAIVLDGAVVGSEALLAAGALLAPGKEVPEGALWAGNPARPRRELGAEERGYMRWNADHYVALAAEHKAL